MANTTLPGTVQQATAGSSGFDVNSILSATDALNLKNAGYDFCLRYIPRTAALGAGNLTNAEALDILNAGLAHYPDLVPEFLDNARVAFLADLGAFNPDASDVTTVLQSEVFSPSDKQKLIKGVSAEMITGSKEVLKEIIRLIFAYPPFTVPKTILIAALQLPFRIEERVKLFNMHYRQFAMPDIPEIFKTFPYPYSDIGKPYKSPVIPYGQENTYLANNLKERKFISNKNEEKKGIRIINFKKEQ